MWKFKVMRSAKSVLNKKNKEREIILHKLEDLPSDYSNQVNQYYRTKKKSKYQLLKTT